VFKSGNVLSSDGRGIVREVRVAVFAVISRHIRKRFSFVLSLSLVLLLLLLLLRATLLLILMRVVFGWNIICCEDKASFGQLFSWIDFSNFLFFRNERKHFPHLHSTNTLVLFSPLGGRERDERTLESKRRRKKNEGLCVLRRAFERERERETVLPRTIRYKMGKSVEPRLWINVKKTKRGKVIPCMEETTALMTALKKNNFDMSKCMRESDLLDKCTSTHAKTPKVKNTINFHLQRLARMAKVAR